MSRLDIMQIIVYKYELRIRIELIIHQIFDYTYKLIAIIKIELSPCMLFICHHAWFMVRAAHLY